MPILGLGMEHLHADKHNSSWICRRHSDNSQKMSPGFTPAVIAILRATKNCNIYISRKGIPSPHALFSALPKLDHLHTLSITRSTCEFSYSRKWLPYWTWSINTSNTSHQEASKRLSEAIFLTIARVCADTTLHPQLGYIGQGPTVSANLFK
ncbi:hypothetical protein OG21DRAFT_836786 [Imleria badia]|nr:hypothetical protein OG21DRAFT_836786 [Imleria badia]